MEIGDGELDDTMQMYRKHSEFLVTSARFFFLKKKTSPINPLSRGIEPKYIGCDHTAWPSNFQRT